MRKEREAVHRCLEVSVHRRRQSVTRVEEQLVVGPGRVGTETDTTTELDLGVVDAGLEALETHGNLLPEPTLASIRENRVALKGPLTTPVGKGFRSVNVTLRELFDLYANVRPVVSMPGTRAPYRDVDIITVRENTEGLYAGAGGCLKRGTADEVAGSTEVSAGQYLLARVVP